MTIIAHISDIHLSPLPPLKARDLIGKRLTGYLNWKLKRKGQLSARSLDNLVKHLSYQRTQMNVVTGDLVNLALDEEVENAARWLKKLGPAERVCLVPGNHDAYVRGSLKKARDAYGPYASGETLDKKPYPFVRRAGEAAIVGCSSAVATPPFIAAGYFDEAQANRLGQCLKILGDAGYYRIVAIHHPPAIEDAHPWRKSLFGAERFRKIIATFGAEMILHGHTHISSLRTIPGPEGQVPVIGVAAASTQPGSNAAPARYNLFQIERLSHGWSCTMREFGYQRLGEDIVQRLQVRIH